MTSEKMTRRLTAILSTDVKGYSRLMGGDEAATVQTITKYRRIISALVEGHQGRVVDSPGDNLLAEFASAVDALTCSVKIQEQLKEENVDLPEHRRMEFRIGLNVGDVITQEGRLYGDGVNIAARLESLGEAGGVCISGTVYDQVKNKLDLAYHYMGEKQVKNIADPVRTYKVIMDPDTEMEVGQLPTEQPIPKEDAGLKLPDRPSIAVMPLVNMSRDPEHEYFSDGLTEDIITDLSKVSGLFVIARNSVFVYKGKSIVPLVVSQELGVRHILEGSVRRAGQRVRISTQLVDAPLNQNIWADRFDGDLEDIFDLQDQVTEKVVSALKIKLTQGEKARLSGRGNVNPEAYDLVLKANKIIMVSTFEANLEARGMYQKAIELDSGYAPAYVGLGWTWLHEWPFGWSEEKSVLDQARELACKAQALDETLPDAYLLESCSHVWSLEHDKAKEAIGRALSIAPNSAEAISFSGYILNFAGRPEEAIAPIQRAMRLDPQVPTHFRMNLGHSLWLLKRYPEAEEELGRIVAANPEFLPPNINLISVYYEWGKADKTREAADRVKKIDPDFDTDKWCSKLPYKDPATITRVREGLQNSGLG